jgi:hypothetical protein
VIYQHPQHQWEAAQALPQPVLPMDWIMGCDFEEAGPVDQWPHYVLASTADSAGDGVVRLQLQDLARRHVLKEVQVDRSHVWGHWRLTVSVRGKPLSNRRTALLAFDSGCTVLMLGRDEGRQLGRDDLEAVMGGAAVCSAIIEACDVRTVCAFLREVYRAPLCGGAYAGCRVPDEVDAKARSDGERVKLAQDALQASTDVSERLFLLSNNAPKQGHVTEVRFVTPGRAPLGDCSLG